MNAPFQTTAVPLDLGNGKIVRIEATQLGGPEKVGLLETQPVRDLVEAIEGLGTLVLDAVKKLAPTKATVEFGVEVAVEAGKITALLCQGSGKANLKITVEWSSGSK